MAFIVSGSFVRFEDYSDIDDVPMKHDYSLHSDSIISEKRVETVSKFKLHASRIVLVHKYWCFSCNVILLTLSHIYMNSSSIRQQSKVYQMSNSSYDIYDYESRGNMLPVGANIG